MRNDSRSFSEMRCNNLTKVPIRVHFVAWAAIVLVTLALVWSTQGVDGRIWSGWAESRELRRPAYAERVQVEAIFPHVLMCGPIWPTSWSAFMRSR